MDKNKKLDEVIVRFGGSEKYLKFFHWLQKDALKKGYSQQAIDKAINILTDLLESYDLTRVDYIKAWATTIFYREAGKVGKRLSEPVYPQESKLTHILSSQEYETLYKEARTLIDSKGGKTQGRLEKYLAGYSLQEIADSEGVKTRQAISKMIAPELDKWGWNKQEIKQIRNAWLLEAMKDIARIVDPLRPTLQSRGYGDLEAQSLEVANWHKELYRILTTDPRIKKFCSKYTLEDMPKLDTALYDITHEDEQDES